MDTGQKNLSTLFEQLGLPHDPVAIDNFVTAHRSLDAKTTIWEAPFWSAAQASFLKEAWEADADWVDAVDELNTLLHQP